MTDVHITFTEKPEAEFDNNELPRCPMCGSKAFISKDVVEGFYFGWSVGCPRACINDKTHKLNEEEFKKARLVFHNLNSREEAILIWKGRCLGESEVKPND